MSSKDEASNLDLVTTQGNDVSIDKTLQGNSVHQEPTQAVPKLQLNKVELHFDYQTSGRVTHQNLTPMLYGHPRFNPFQGRLGINNRVQHITTVMNPMNQDQSTRTTKMINIEMQTDGKRKITESKLNIVTQEKSV